ncbi:MAG: serine/threonine protein kinase [Acidobacteria bacterium]|nr:serine/threonine protein kinase [Acidobacteriota bacterium]
MAGEAKGPDSSHPLLFDHYEIVEVLGEGAMGTVYLARDIRLGRRAALKTLKKVAEALGPDDSLSEEFMARFRREAEVCGSLIHPNIVTLYEVGYSHREIRYMAMEFVEGESLLTILKRRSKLGVLQAAGIGLDILRGLAYAHQRGIIHRDIKPANILVTDDGRAKIADFGVARTVREGATYATKAGQLLGTPYYMSPEVVAGKSADERSDLFSVGVLLYEMWSGKRPFEGESVMDVLYDVVNREPSPITVVAPDIPKWCEHFLSRMISKSPATRFISAASAAQELERLINLHRANEGESEPVESFTTPASPEDTPTTRLGGPKFSWTRLRILHVPRGLAIGLIAVLLCALFLLPVVLREEDPAGFPLVPDARREFAEKEELLRKAQILHDAGAYAQSLEVYDEILDKYPNTPSAIEGRKQVLDRLFPLDDNR